MRERVREIVTDALSWCDVCVGERESERRAAYIHAHMHTHTYTPTHIRWAAYLGEKAEPQVVLRDYWESENEDDHQVIIDASLRHALLKRDEL